MSPGTRSGSKRSRRDESESDEEVNFNRSARKRRRILPSVTSSDSEENSGHPVKKLSHCRRGNSLKKKTCNICNRFFQKVAHLRDHLAIHDPDRQKYVCSYPKCKKEYNEVKNWRAHFLKHHAKGSKTQKKNNLKKYEHKLKKVKRIVNFIEGSINMNSIPSIILATSDTHRKLEGENGRAGERKPGSSNTSKI